MRIAITVEVDEKQWADEYGVASKDARKDIQSWIKTALYSAEVPIRVVK